MTHLSLTNIHKQFATTTVVQDFNLEIEKGELISFLGPSGCGKTTTLRMVAGFETPTAGAIVLDGEDITAQPPNKRNVGMVFQSYALFPNLTVAQNIAFGLEVRKMPAAEAKQRVKEMMALIHLEEFGGRYPSQLSGGQQQRVALARALAIHPHVLLLDEPLSALDAKIRVELRQEIRRIQQQLGITTIYVTHDQEEALSLSDRVVVMSRGRIEQVGAPFEIYNYPTSEFVASFVGQINLLPVNLVQAGERVVRIEGQTLRAGRSASHSLGGDVRLAVRPEEIHPGHVEGHNHLSGQVESIAYLGSIVRIRLALEDAALSMDMFNNHTLHLPQVGEQFEVHFPVEACWLI
ncbi:MAG: ABC transporter ATP-binding protein [Chloroflexi bacterium]|nr:ABC transporter ATP-binding protein [Chloroflexota bacterium]